MALKDDVQRLFGETVITLFPEEEEEFFTEGKVLTTDERNSLNDSSFALIQKKDGKKVRRFPINDCVHAQNALSQLPKAKNISESEREAVRKKATAAKNKLCATTIDDDKEYDMNELEQVKEQLAEAIATKEAVATEKATIEAERDEIKASLEEIQTMVAGLEVKIADTEKENTVLRRARLLGADFDDETATVVASMDDAQWALYMAAAKKEESIPPERNNIQGSQDDDSPIEVTL